MFLWLLCFLWRNITVLCSGDELRREKCLTELSLMGYSQKQDKIGFFTNVMTALPLSGLFGPALGTLAESREPFRHPATSRRKQKWENGRIIPVIGLLVVSAGGGLLLSFAFYPLRLDFLAWIAFVPLFWAIHKDSRPAFAALYGMTFGIAFFSVDLSWIHHALAVHGRFGSASTLALFVGVILTLALFPEAFAFVSALLLNRGIPPALAAPFLWTALEYFRTGVFTGFPWDLSGYSQVGRETVIQIADITGVYGVSFLLLLVNGSLWEVMRATMKRDRFPVKLVATTGLTLLLVLVYGSVRIAYFSTDQQYKSGVVVGILQGNIPQEIKWKYASRRHTFATYERLGEKAVQEGAQLLVWPETSAPVLFGGSDPDWQRPGEISLRLKVPMLVGAPSTRTVGGIKRYYNSAFLVDGTELRYRYDKIHLVPFGEYMPLAWLLPLGHGIATEGEDYSPGEEMTVMHLEEHTALGVLICYESIFPEIARTAIGKGASVLLNITNDGWFGDTAAPYQHLAMARMRSLENRVWLVRSANTGVSAVFDPTGRMVSRIPLNQEGICTVRVPSSSTAGSFYTRFGDLFAWCCISVSIILGLTAIKFGRAPQRKG
jgi:apolipoprotein N-acyltransferase